MTTAYSVKLGVLRRFVRIVSVALVAGGVPVAVAAVQSPEIYELGSQLLGAAGVAVAAGALAALDKAVRSRYGSWLGVCRSGSRIAG